MAANFIVEDGTGIAGSNSFVALAYADQYFLDRAVTTWTGLDADKQSALVRATDYINNRFRFRGAKVDDAQSLEFPRDLAGPLPDKLLRATCEYAIRCLGGTPLAPDPTVDASGQRIASTKETVGPISEEIAYHPGGIVFVFRPYPAADMLLRDLIITGGTVIRN